jgi:radical SAM superfamily enzyme YgiQ (UPF0313 family)
MKLDLFRKQTTIEQNKKAIRLIREAGIVAEAQFIIGLEGETKETIEETYRYARAELFEDLGDRVEVRDYAKYNFVTPIMKPARGVAGAYRRFRNERPAAGRRPRSLRNRAPRGDGARG